MKFTHYDLGNRKRGEIVEVSLTGSAANVRLMNSSNFNSYRRGKQHRYIGGLATLRLRTKVCIPMQCSRRICLRPGKGPTAAARQRRPAAILLTGEARVKV